MKQLFKPLALLLVDENQPLLTELSATLAGHVRVLSASSRAAAMMRIRAHEHELCAIVTQRRLCDGDGLDIVREAALVDKQLPFLLTCEPIGPHDCLDSFVAGGRGVPIPRGPTVALARLIPRFLGQWIRREHAYRLAAARLRSPDGLSRLTEQMTVVMGLRGSGVAPTDIAVRLDVTRRTVYSHVRDARGIVGARSVAELNRFLERERRSLFVCDRPESLAPLAHRGRRESGVVEVDTSLLAVRGEATDGGSDSRRVSHEARYSLPANDQDRRSVPVARVRRPVARRGG